MCRQLKSVQPDIYHGLSQELPLGINKTGIKSVVTMHDAIFMRFPNLYPRAYRTVFIQKNNYACRVADRIIAISEQTKRDLMEFFDADEQKISVIYQGCNLRFRQPVLTETKLVVKRKYQLPDDFLLTVGAIEKRKNAALIIEALYRFRLKIPLIIIGQTSPYLKELLSMIKKYRMEKQVFFIHSVDPADLPAIYSLAGLFIYPSIFEGFGIPILEALCSGIPVIASTGSCLEESGGPFSRYINPKDADELGEAMTHLLADDLAKERMIKEGLSFSEQFTDDKIASRLMHVYQSI
jgi:glycosyltransferase involved in cell wall biosynthesis